MSLLDLFVVVATAVYVAVGLVVGVRLLRLARRTRGFPEWALGLGRGLVGIGGVLAAGAPLLVSLCGVNAAEHAPTRLLCGFGTLASSVFVQLAFLPPERYLAWVGGRARRADA
jgi:hypothetical protein